MRVLQHLLMFRLENYSREDIGRLQAQMRVMQDTIPGIIYGSFDEAAHNVHRGHVNRTKGYTHTAIVLFRDAKSLENYMPHPEHVKLNNMAKQFVVDKVCVDSWTDNFPSKL
mmetsp:Transcript_46615/g.74678  ORF Transcript_46615/g.74678 Transcript_46615/m.74678 type:complete len:112 (-) Transcript_46615:65-400(-)